MLIGVQHLNDCHILIVTSCRRVGRQCVTNEQQSGSVITLERGGNLQLGGTNVGYNKRNEWKIEFGRMKGVLR